MLLHGDCLEKLKELNPDSIDSIVTDPPAGISFMGKDWDSNKGGSKEWIASMTQVMQECLRVLKPGGHAFVWAIPRTSHWTATAIENAGFEIRDVITHLFGSGFPKSHNISKALTKKGITDHAFDGFGTALKPASEHWILCRKPFKGSVVDNVLKHGTGGINIDECRVEVDNGDPNIRKNNVNHDQSEKAMFPIKDNNHHGPRKGRFPANLLLSHHEDCADTCHPDCPVRMLDEDSIQAGIHFAGKARQGKNNYDKNKSIFSIGHMGGSSPRYDDTNANVGASRFFKRFKYQAKASKSERNEGVKELITWENVDLNLADLMEDVNQHLKDISEGTLQKIKNTEWNTILFGSNTTEKYQKDIRFIIRMVIKLIIELKTLNYSQHLSTKDIILDVIRTITERGLNLVESAEAISQLKQIFIKEELESVHGVSLAVLKMLIKIKEKGRQGNIHSTVKPIALMQYLITMITPPNGTVLDPFMGSGSTGVAAVKNNFNFIGVEQNTEYYEIAKRRVENALI